MTVGNEAQWGKVLLLVERHDRDLYDKNGGLQSEVQDLKIQINGLIATSKYNAGALDRIGEKMENIRIAVSGIEKACVDMDKWRTSHEKETKEKEKQASDNMKDEVDQSGKKKDRFMYGVMLVFVLTNIVIQLTL